MWYRFFRKLERSLIHTCWPGHGENIENEDDDLVEEDVVEQVDDLIETQNLRGTTKWFNFSIKSVLYVMKEIVFLLLDNAVINVFVSNVIKKNVILIY